MRDGEGATTKTYVDVRAEWRRRNARREARPEWPCEPSGVGEGGWRARREARPE
jgi:hypothetical protein